MKQRILFFGILLIIAVFYVGGCRRAGNWLVKDDVPEHADAMVLLMGVFPDRVLQAADLYHDRKAGRLIIVQEGMGPFKVLESKGVDIIRSTEQAHDACVTLGIPADSITVLPGDARSTLDEAVAVRDYLSECRTIDTILLVSEPAHMRRASMIFKAAFRGAEIPVHVCCSPSAYTNFNADRWWKDREGVQTVLSEYVKIGIFVVFEKKKLGVN